MRAPEALCHQPSSKKTKPEEPAKAAEQEAIIEDFPEMIGCLMISGGSEAYGEKRRLKVVHHEVHAADPAIS